MERLSAEPLPPTQLRNLRYFWLDGFFASISGNFYAGFVTLFMLAYGATNAQIGSMTAIASLLGALALFPGARAIALFGSRKRVVMWVGAGLGRVVLLIWACLPFLTHNPAVAIGLMIALNATLAFMNNFINPGWTSLVADMVPFAIRGRYFSSRNLAMTVPALLVVPLAGWLISAGNRLPGLPFGGYQLIFFAALATGMGSTFAFGHIVEPPDSAAGKGTHRLGDMIKTLRKTPGFMGFVISAFVWNVALQVAGPFFNVYLVNDLGGTAADVGLLAAVSSVFALLSQGWCGRLVDRKGNIWVQGVFGLIIPVMPLAWMIVKQPWQIIFINAAGGVLWAGYNLANFNLLLEMTPPGARADASAFYQFVVGGSAVLAPVLGGYLADAYGFRLIFGLSAVLRWMGVLLFLWLAARPALRAHKQARVEA
jgi:MFS family permease